jgi:hypothetical protein
LPIPATAVDNHPQTPYQIVHQLRDRLYVVGETTGQQHDFLAAVEHSRQELSDYIAAGGDPSTLVEKGANGQTPLILAAWSGYGDIVAELLKNESVVASINDVDQDGLSAWMYANFAPQEAFWTCNPAIFEAPSALVSKMVTLFYYLSGEERPYRKTRRLLEAAGAKADLSAAKQRWLATCKFATPEMREKVAASNDLLVTVEAEGLRMVSDRYKAGQKKPTSP